MKSDSTTESDRQLYLDRALAAADWFVNSQANDLPAWDANGGRFLYYYYMPEGKSLYGIVWTHGRALFVLAEAYRITGDRRYLESAETGARYLFALQETDPHYAVTYGAFHERTPQADFGGTLDSAQAAAGLLVLYEATGNPDYLRRGRLFCQYLARTWRADYSFTFCTHHHEQRVEYYEDPWEVCIHACTAIPLWHLYRITGEGQHLHMVVDSAERILKCQRSDGALKWYSDTSKIDPSNPNHHWGHGEGEDRFSIVNDDGCVTVVLAAYMITGDVKYLDAMVAYADWTVHNLPQERPYNAFGIQAANVLDVGRASGMDYTPWVFDNLKTHCLDLQVVGSEDPKAEGGFRGEDEEGDGGVFGGTSLDYVPTRNTCYMAGLLFRLSGKGTGAGFSAWGLGGR